MGLIKAFAQTTAGGKQREVGLSSEKVKYIASRDAVKNPNGEGKLSKTYVPFSETNYFLYVYLPMDVVSDLIAITTAMGAQGVLDLRDYSGQHRGIDPETGEPYPLPEPEWLEVPPKPECAKSVSKLGPVIPAGGQR